MQISRIHHHLKRNFLSLGIVIFVLGAIIWALAWPHILHWRDHQLDGYITTAQQKTKAGDSVAAMEALQKADVIGFLSPRPGQAWADFFISRGRYDLAVKVLSRWPQQTQPAQLAEYSLKAQDYQLAGDYFTQALVKNSSASLHAGLAMSLFNREDTGKGCDEADRAIKSNLSDFRAQQAQTACLLFKEGGMSRAAAYQLYDAQVYHRTEKILSNLTDKTPTDWLTLSQLQAARGEYGVAIETAQKGLVLDPTNRELNIAIARYYTATGDTHSSDIFHGKAELLTLP